MTRSSSLGRIRSPPNRDASTTADAPRTPYGCQRLQGSGNVSSSSRQSRYSVPWPPGNVPVKTSSSPRSSGCAPSAAWTASVRAFGAHTATATTPGDCCLAPSTATPRTPRPGRESSRRAAGVECAGEAVADEVHRDEQQDERERRRRPCPPAEREEVELADAALRRLRDQVAESRPDERVDAETEELCRCLDEHDLADERRRRDDDRPRCVWQQV